MSLGLWIGTSALLSIVMSGCRGGEGSVIPKAAPKPVSVETTKATREDVERLITLPAEIVPVEQATLYAKVAGTLGKLLVDRGDRVHAGQLIAVIDAPEMDADAQQARGNLAAAEAVARTGRVVEQRASSQTKQLGMLALKAGADVDQARSELDRLQVKLGQDRRAIELAKARRVQADAAHAEATASLRRASADFVATEAELKFADATAERYRGIQQRDPRLIALQDVEASQAKAAAARAKMEAARSAVQSADAKRVASEAGFGASEQEIAQATDQVRGTEQDIATAKARLIAIQKQAAATTGAVDVGRKDRQVAAAKTQEARQIAIASQGALNRTSTLSTYRQIHAPFDGVVTQRHVDQGAFIQTAAATPSAAAIVTVAKTGRLRVRFFVPEVEATFMRVGSPVNLVLPGAEEPIKLNVSRTSGAIDPKTRTLLAEADLDNRTNSVLAGGYGSVKVTLDVHRHVVAAPSGAIGKEKSGPMVYAIEGGKAKRVAIKLGFDDGKHAEIEEGVKPGDEVVVVGRDALTPNAQVNTKAWLPPVKTKPGGRR